MEQFKTSKIPHNLDSAQSVLFYATKIAALKREIKEVKWSHGSGRIVKLLSSRVSVARRAMYYHAEKLTNDNATICKVSGGTGRLARR